ncbi:MAG: extracellular solute-binding protein [Clostridiales bacterium]|nr:extracellular solute-binding protein [Clostridiales bacterium]
MKRRVWASLIVLALLASLMGCHKTEPSVTKSITDSNGNSSDDSGTVFQVGEDTANYFACKNLDYSLPDNDSRLTVYGGMISDTSVWTVVLSEADEGCFYLEQFDFDGNREETIELGSFSDVALGYDTPYMYEDDQKVYVVSYPSPQALHISFVDKENHNVGRFEIKLETEHIGEMLGVRQDLFYVMSCNNSGEFVCYGYDLSSGECKFKTEPDAEAWSYVWKGDTLFQLNQTGKSGVYRVFEISAGGGVTDRGEIQMPSEYGKIHYYNGKQYYSGDEGVWYLNEETSTWENIILWDNSGIDMTDIPADLRVVSKDLDRILTCGRDTKNVSLFQEGADPKEGKTSLLVVGFYASDKVISAIQEFNNSNTDCFIEYKNYAEIVDLDDYEDQNGSIDFDAYDEAVFDYFWKEISKGEGPDLLLRSGNENGGKYESRFYEYGGLLQDLLPLWEKEDLTWRDLYYTNLIDQMKNRGGLYSLPYEYQIINYVILENDAVDTKPTYSEWLKFMDAHADGRVLVRMTGQDFLLNCLCYDAASFVDEKAGKSQFSCQEFKDLLRLSKEYCMSIDEWNNMSEREAVLAKKRLGGSSCNEIAINYDYETESQFYGLISKDGGHACLSGESVSITSNCKDLEGAWEFIKILLSPSTQEYYLRMEDEQEIGMTFFPVLRSSMDYLLDFDLDPKAHERFWQYQLESAELEDDWTIDDITPMTEEEAQTVRDFISSVDYVYYSDYEIVNVVMEESAPYFAGQKSLDEVVAIIDNRVQTILNERQ